MEKPNLLFISADKKIALGAKNSFYAALRGLSEYFGQIMVLTPTNDKGMPMKLFDNVTLYPSPFSSKSKQDNWKEKKFMVEKAQKLNITTPINLIVSDFIGPSFNQIKAGTEIKKLLNIPLAAEFLVTPGFPKADSSAEVVQKMLVKDFLKLYKSSIDLYRVKSIKDTAIFLINEMGIPPEKIKAIPPYYINTNIFKDLTKEREPFSLLFAGSLEDNNGLYLLIDAIKKARPKIANIKLYIIGEGSLKEDLIKYVSDYGLSKRVIFLRWQVNLQNVALKYNMVKAFVMPYYKNLNYKICLEAMACKTPVLLPNTSTADFIEDGKNAVLFDQNSDDLGVKILKVLKDDAYTSNIAINAYNTALEFEQSKTIKKYADIYLNVISTFNM